MTYQICEVGNPTNCDTAIATIVVADNPIVANDDDFTSTPITSATGGATPSVFSDDTLNSAAFANGDVTPSITADGGLTGVTINADGTLSVPAGAAPGTYQVTYQICEVGNPTNCDTAVATVVVDPNTIVAQPESFIPINGTSGGSTPSVLTSDTLNGTPIDPADVNITVDASDPELNLDPTTGVITIAPGTPAGTYSVTYTVCETANPSNCATVTETVTVEVTPIVADDDVVSSPVDGVSGGATPSVFDNDTLGGSPFAPTDVTVAIVDDGGLTGVSVNPDGTLGVPPGTPAGIYVVEYEICETANPTNCDTATITIEVATTSSISGVVFEDTNGDGTFQPNEPPLGGYIVEIFDENGNVVATVVTDGNGAYTSPDLPPGTYSIVFRDPETGTAVGGIEGVDTTAGDVIVDQNLPIDPSGVIYDAATGDPVIGVIATLTTADGTPLPAVCFIDASQQNQVTGSDGRYRFDLVPGADPLCPLTETEYQISLIMPDGSPAIYGFSPQPNPLDATSCPIDAIPGGDCQVFGSSTQPAIGTPSIFFDSFLLETGDPNVINNHIPVNLSSGTLPLFVTKTSTSRTASTGSLIVYTITVQNEQSVDINDADVIDNLPTGFKYVEGSARVDDVADEPVMSSAGSLIWEDVDIPAGGSTTIQLGTIVGSGVRVGEYINEAYVQTGVGSVVLSNVAEATVRVTPDEVFDCSEVIGKVFADGNQNGVQDEGEKGLPGVRLATVKGLLITTDEYGRYHIACAATPRSGIGSNFILKVDERTLPTGYSITTENPRVHRLTQGKLGTMNFGASMQRVVRMDLMAHAFAGNTSQLTPEYQVKLQELFKVLRQQPSTLKLTYSGGDGGKRLEAVAAQIRRQWEDGPYDLKIDIQTVASSDAGGR